MTTYHSKKLSMQNVVTFTCSNDAADTLVKVLKMFRDFGEWGHSVSFKIEGKSFGFDGDGEMKIGSISVNGWTLDEWESEFHRLMAISGNDTDHPDNQQENAQ